MVWRQSPDRGDFTSDDLELLVTLSGYVGIAIENALLYQSLRHKAAEYERLKEYNENIVESINVGILAADLEGRVESWNSTMETLTGVPRNIAVGRRMEELLPADLCREIASVGAAESVHNIYQYEFRSSMLPSRTPETAPVARTFQAEAPSYSPAMGFATGGEESDAFALQPAAAHAGSTGHAGTRMTAPASYGGPGIAPAVASAPEVFKGAGGTNGSNGVPDGNGSIPSSETEENRLPEELTLNIAVTPVGARDFEHIGRLVLFQDVTERTELERRLVQSDKLTSIGVLAAGVAHEVNTPLAVISSYSQMLAKQLADDERKSGLLDKIAKQTFRASEIVNSLLNFSRTSNTTYGSTDLNSVVEETLLLIAPQLEKARIRVERDMQAPLPSIRERQQTQQVFLNIILNARDSMSDGGIRAFASDATSVCSTPAMDSTDKPRAHSIRSIPPRWRQGTGLD